MLHNTKNTDGHPPLYLQKKMKASSQCKDSDNTWQNLVTSRSCVHVYVCVFYGWWEDFKYQSLSYCFYYHPEEKELLPHCCVAWKHTAASGVQAVTSCRGGSELVFSISPNKLGPGIKLVKRHRKTLKVNQHS